MSFDQIGSVYGVILNDHDSLESLGSSVNDAPYKAAPNAPILYIKPRNTFVKDGAIIVPPEGVSELEIGATLGIEFAYSVANCTLENALDGVLGYRVVADLSIPHSSYYRPAIKEKCFDGSCLIGELTLKGQVVNPDALMVTTFVDGKSVHTWKLETLLRNVRQLIVDVSAFITFQEHDLLLVGVPIGAARVKQTQVFQVHIPELESSGAQL
jgi:5-oxopent-3-ene-1,2,5-tricarboxylate decarboxylase / 2-hydroxyhepta-2,4-diene-1,7-dioate isomerase